MQYLAEIPYAFGGLDFKQNKVKPKLGSTWGLERIPNQDNLISIKANPNSLPTDAVIYKHFHSEEAKSHN